MTSPKDTPPASAVVDSPAPAPGPGEAALPTTTQPHWTRGALNSAGRLITTAANDDFVRNMIGARARSQVATTVFGGTVLGAIAARIATRSVPGALLVGGALVAKALYDQRKNKVAPPKP